MAKNEDRLMKAIFGDNLPKRKIKRVMLKDLLGKQLTITFVDGETISGKLVKSESVYILLGKETRLIDDETFNKIDTVKYK